MTILVCLPLPAAGQVPAEEAYDPGARPGQGSSFEAGYALAYQAAGSRQALGSPINLVYRSGPGCIQDLQGPKGHAALMSPDCGLQVYLAPPDLWGWFGINLGDGPFEQIGLAADNVHRWGTGWAQDYRGGRWGHNIMLKSDRNGRWHNVSLPILQTYIAGGGPAGSLGFPVAEPQWDGLRVSQAFDGGRIFQRPDGGLQVDLPPLPQVGPGLPVLPVREAQAIQWALSQVGQTTQPNGLPWNGWCDRFVANAFDRANSGYNTATQHFVSLQQRGMVNLGRYPPPGALVFAGGDDSATGHVALAIGNGQFVDTGPAIRVVGWEVISIGGYRGWSYADPEWPGRG